MNARMPPRAATWLLMRLGGEARFEPLIGDLEEQFEQGHSRLWYWRQATGALAIAFARTLRLHALSFIAAVLVGCALIWLWDVECPYAFAPLYENLPAVSRHPWSAQALLRVAGLQFHGFLGDALTFTAVWIATRIHRAHPRAVLVAVVVALSAPSLPNLAQLVIHAAAGSRSTTPWVPTIMPVAFPAVCTLAAGLWVIRGLRFNEMDPLTRIVAVLAASVAVLVGLAHRAQLVGELTYTLLEANVLAVLDVACMTYLILLLWRLSSAPRTTGHPPTQARGGPRAEAMRSR